MAEFCKGDIVRNIFAGKNNPTAYLLYLGKGTCRQGRYSHKVYNCIGYDGTKVQIFRENDPLVVVGHMAEFDAFIAALRSLAERKDADNEENFNKQVEYGATDSFCAVEDALQDTPTLTLDDIVPHGRWIEQENWDVDDYLYTCSVCKEDFVTIDGTPADNMYNYCPNCGAKMDLEEV